MRDKFLDLWKSSALIQGIMALAVTFTICYMEAAGRDVSPVLVGLVATIIGFYFGTKNRTLH
ncbi:MAG: hypothetical protein KAX80_00020 [Planctomycetes bacterium]|nr:hypothetical protein [Planctomycetota bacterium]